MSFTTQPPASTTDGTFFSVAVTVVDAAGDPVSAGSQAVSIQLAPNVGGATLSSSTGTSVVPGSNGVATFTVSLNRPGNGYAFVARYPGVTNALSSSFNVTVGSASQLAFTTQPSAINAGGTITPAVAVGVLDSSGVLNNTATNMVALVLSNNTTGAVLSGTTTVAAVNGIATFANLSVDRAGSYTLTASGVGGASPVSQFFAVGGGAVGAATKLVVSTQPVSTTAGASIPVTVQVQDNAGNVVTSAANPIALSLFTNPTGATLGGTTSVNAVNGIATFSVSVNRVGTGYSLSATATGLAVAASAAFDIAAGAPSLLAFTTQPSNANAGASIAPPITVEIRDASGNRITGASTMITIAVASGPGVLSGTATVAASSGIATFNNLSLNLNGTYTFSASAPPVAMLTPATSSSFVIGGVVMAGPGTKLSFSTQPASSTAGAAIAVAVQVLDNNNALVSSATNSITVSLFTNPGGGTLSGTKTVTAVNGVANFSLSVDRAASGYSMVATTSGLTPGVSAAFDINVGSLNKLAFIQGPTAVAPGANLAPAVTVAFEDSSGNVLTAQAGNITVALGNNVTGATLTGTLAQPAASGIATFNNLNVNLVGTYTLIATSPPTGATTYTSSTFPVGGGATGSASRLVFSTQPVTSAAGANIAMTVQVQDGSGNVVSSATNAITIGIFTNPSSGALSGTRTVAAVNGVASFSLSVDKIGTGYSLSATATGLSVGISSAFDITLGAAAKLAFAQQPSNAAMASAIAPPITVAIQDAGGNTIPGATNTVTMAFGSNPTGATLGGTTSQAAVNGLATFNNLTVDKAGTYTLTASTIGPVLTPATSGNFTITTTAMAGSASKLAFAMQPVSGTAGTNMTVTVQVQDSSGTLVNSATNIVSIANAAGGGAPLSGTTTATAVNGVATFTISVAKSGTGYFLNATSPGLQVAISASFDVNAGAANKLVYLQQPSQAGVGAVLSPAISVAVEDVAGNILTGNSSMITLAFNANPGGATLGGTVAQAASMGVATFNNITVSAAGTGYTLDATDGPLAKATSNGFNIGSGGGGGMGNKLVFTTQPVDSGATSNIMVAVQVQDSAGNLLNMSSAAVTFSLFTNPIGFAQINFMGFNTNSVTINAVNGIANFTFQIHTAASGFSLAASASGINVAVSQGFNIVPGPKSKLLFLSQPNNAQVNTIIMPAPSVLLTDQFNNVIVNGMDLITVALGNNPTGATLSGTLTQAAMGGTATFNDLKLDKSFNNFPAYTLVATSGVLTPATSNNFTVNAGPPVALFFATQPQTPVTAGNSFNPSPVVGLMDMNGNVAFNTTGLNLVITVTPAAASNIPASSCTIFTNNLNCSPFSMNPPSKTGTFTMTATAPGMTQVVSNSFTVNAGPPNRVTFVQQPTNTAFGATITPAVTVAVTDNVGNVVTSASDTITLTLQSQGTFNGTLSQPTVMGVATFNDLSINGVNGTGSKILSPRGATFGFGNQSAAFTITSGPATQIVITGQPTCNGCSVTAGQNLQVTAVVEDASNNPVTTPPANPVTIAIGTNPGAATLLGTTSITLTGASPSTASWLCCGQAPGIDITKIGNGYTLTVSSMGLPSVTTTPFNVVGSNATKFVFTQQPTNTKLLGAFAPVVTVSSVDQFGNATSTCCGNLVMTLNAGASGASLLGTTTQAANSGATQFANLTIDTAGMAFTLTATPSFGGFAPVTSTAFNVAASAWSAANSGLDLGDVLTVAVAPSSASTLYAATNGGGVYKSIDSGATWTAKNAKLFTPFINTIAVHPTNPSIVYAGTTGGGFKSTDGGTTWTNMNIPFGCCGKVGYNATQFSIPAMLPTTIYVASSNDQGAVSTDSGTTWTAYPCCSTSSAAAVAADPTDVTGKMVYYAGGGIQKSLNGGTSFVSASSGYFGTANTFLIDPNNVLNLYACSSSGMFKSTNGAGAWAQVANFNNACSGLAMAPSATTNLIALQTANFTPTQNGVFQTTDGTTWFKTGPAWTASTPYAIGARVVNGVNLYTCTTAGTSAASGGPSGVGGSIADGTVVWAFAPFPLTNRAVRSFAFDPGAVATVYAGTQGGGVFKSIDKALTFAPSTAGIGAAVVKRVLSMQDVANPTSYWLAATGGGVFKTTNGGTSWTATPTVSPVLYMNDLAAAKSAPNTLYIVDNGTNPPNGFRTTDGGTTWTKWLTVPSACCSAISTMAVHPTTSTTLLVGDTNGKTWTSTNGGDAWTQITGFNSGTPMQIVYDVINPMNVYMATQFNGIFKSTGGGATGTFQAQSVGLTNNQMQTIAVTPAAGSNNILYAGGLSNTYKASDLAVTWAVSNGPFNTSPQHNIIQVDPVNTTIVYDGWIGDSSGNNPMGLWRSSNSGGTWGYVGSGIINLFVGGLGLDPVTSGNVVLGTLGGGVYTTTTGGL